MQTQKQDFNFEITFKIAEEGNKISQETLEKLIEQLYEVGLSDTLLALGQEGHITCVGTRNDNNIIEVYRSVILDFKKVVPTASIVVNNNLHDDNFWESTLALCEPLKMHSSVIGRTGGGMSFYMNRMMDDIIRKSRSIGGVMLIDRGYSYLDFYDEQQKHFMEDNIIHLQKKENINQFKQRVQKKLVEKDQLKYNMKYFASREFNKEIQKAFSIKKYYIS